MKSGYVCPLHCMQQESAIVMEPMTSVLDTTSMALVFFNEESRFTTHSDFSRIIIWRERGTGYHTSYIKEIEDLLAKDSVSEVT